MKKPHGVQVDPDHLKMAVRFENEVFLRILGESEERGATFSDHVNWLLKKGWRLEVELTGLKEPDLQDLQKLHRLERRTISKITRRAEERRE